MKAEIEIDSRVTTVWGIFSSTRPTGLVTKEFFSNPGVHGGRFTPRRLGPSGILLQSTGQETGYQLLLESEKLEVWPSRVTPFEEITAIDTIGGSLKTRMGMTIPAQVTRKPLTESEIRILQTERLIAATLPVCGVQPRVAEVPVRNTCGICGWQHDALFTQILIPGKEPITLRGVLPDIVAVVHKNQEKGFPMLSTKDDGLTKCCGGYGNPCKAFYNLHQTAAYKVLFDTSRRGSIALRRVS